MEKEEVWVTEVKLARDKELHPTAIPGRYEFRPPLMGSILYCTMCAKPITSGVITNLMDLIKEAQAHERTNHADR